jgi:hypothetical protein
MATITKRSVKGSPLTNDEVDDNFDNLNTGKLEITASTGSATVPKGTTAQRDGSPATGMFRYNSTLEEFEGYTDNGWIGIGDGLDSAEVIQLGHDALDGFVANEHIDHSSVSITAGNGLTGGGTIAATRTIAIGAGTGITVGSNDISTNDGAIVHDDLSGFVANEHIDHSSVSVTAGAGLTGGGTIASTRTINVVGGTGITANADDIATNDGEIVHDNLSGFVANEHIDHTGVSITAGAGLTGGGTIAATRDIAVGAGTGITVNANDIATNDGAIVHDNLSGFVANEHIDHSGVSITAGAGLTGGGTIAATRDIAVGAGTGITVNANDIATNDGAIVHDNLSGFVANEHIDHTSVTFTAGTGLTGGGTLAANRTFNVSGVTSSMFSSAVSLIIYNSSGTALKTIYSPGS